MRDTERDPYRDFYGNIYDRGREQRAPGEPPVDPPPPPAPPPESTPPPPVADTTGTTPPGGWQAWFNTLIGGKTPSLETFKALEPELAKYGAKWETNASGQYNGNIVIPGLGSIDVAHGNGSGGWDAWQWFPDNGQSGSDGAPIEVNPEYLTPFTEQFNYADFQAPTWDSLRAQDPGIDFRIKTGQGMYENSAASRGLTNSGGSLYDLASLGQQMGSQEYGAAFNRAFNLWDTGQKNAWQKYVENKDTFYKNQTNPWTKLYQGASLGASAASA